jgi:hypothetical protein
MLAVVAVEVVLLLPQILLDITEETEPFRVVAAVAVEVVLILVQVVTEDWVELVLFM